MPVAGHDQIRSGPRGSAAMSAWHAQRFRCHIQFISSAGGGLRPIPVAFAANSPAHRMTMLKGSARRARCSHTTTARREEPIMSRRSSGVRNRDGSLPTYVTWFRTASLLPCSMPTSLEWVANTAASAGRTILSRIVCQLTKESSRHAPARHTATRGRPESATSRGIPCLLIDTVPVGRGGASEWRDARMARWWGGGTGTWRLRLGSGTA